MKRRTMMLLAAAGTALFSGSALAQGRPLPPQPPPPRTQQATAGAAIPPAPPAPAMLAPRAYYPNVYGQPAFYTSVPVTVASDGRVYANFGFGYTLVPQQCSVQRLRQRGDGAGTVHGQVVQPHATQPVPQGVTPAPNPNGTSAAQPETGPCWTRAPNGLVVVYR
ncbi:MAG: hypothetical protein WBQ26_02355 [Gemmatimonadaceae bacterium]|nr:hypothetical protein [Gemmatimonadaceae bacterium]